MAAKGKSQDKRRLVRMMSTRTEGKINGEANPSPFLFVPRKVPQ